MICNALTIDVEDYYMVSAFADVIKFEDWHKYESRVVRNTNEILGLLDEHGVKATFFVLGWIAEHCPALVRNIYDSGHEVASHGYNHRLIYDLTPVQFREDVQLARDILENIIGQAVKGYRAASYSVVKSTLWALDILVEEGFLYDSSIFPIRHDRYGFPEAHRFPHIVKTGSGRIVEFPPSTYTVFGQNLPVAGGGYLRLLPLRFTKTAVRRINTRERRNAMIYVHPWEIDSQQPRLQGRWLSRLRHYINIGSTMPKLRELLTEFRFKPLSALIDQGEGIWQ
jgi:polysaccharide deacetylase family protein (PEP-CTERM system associated)